MKLLAVVTTTSIYHDCSTRKTFWKGKFTGKEHLFLAVNMKNYGRRNVREHKEIKGGDKYVTLDISSKFDSLENMKTTSSESKRKLERSGKELITSLSFTANIRPQKYKKARYAIRNISKKDLSNIIKDFEIFYKLPYEKKSPKHEPTESYFFLSKHLAKCLMISKNLNWHDHGGYTEMTAMSLNVNATDEDESKRIIVHEVLSENCSTNVSESKKNIVNKNLLQNNYADVSEYTFTKLKEKKYKEPSVTEEMTNYFNIFECGRNLLDKLKITYQEVFMATPKDK